MPFLPSFPPAQSLQEGRLRGLLPPRRGRVPAHALEVGQLVGPAASLAGAFRDRNYAHRLELRAADRAGLQFAALDLGGERLLGAGARFRPDQTLAAAPLA